MPCVFDKELYDTQWPEDIEENSLNLNFPQEQTYHDAN